MKCNLIEKFEYFTFDLEGFTTERGGRSINDGFVLKARLAKIPKEIKSQTLFKLGGIELRFERRSASEKESFAHPSDRAWLYADEDGYVDFLEMKGEFCSPYTGERREMVCELLLNLFDAEKETAYFVYDGVRFFWVYRGEAANVDYPFGDLVEKEEFFASELLREWGVAPLSAMREEEKTEKVEKNMAFYSPRGYNVWAGDIANFYKDGVYHLIYFYDRHHHGSRWGGGAHHVRQITTRDFRDFEERGPLMKLDKQWKTVGTGTMFFKDGKYYYSHGWHTSRMVPDVKTGSELLRAQSEPNEIHGATYAEIFEKGYVPSGANYVVSDDGISFTGGEYQFHTAENPSVYAEKDGSLTMYGGYGGAGMWKAENIKGPWTRADGFEMNASPLNPSTECPSKFELNGYKYLLVGGTGFWQTEKESEIFKDAAKEGYDVYDGLFVPMVTKTEDDRLIYGGWIRGYGWGSVAIHRELFQGEKGRLYMRWLPEFAPQAEEMEESQGPLLNERTSYYLEADIAPERNGKVGLRFIGESDCMLLLDSEKESIQISGVEKEEKYPKEILPLYLRAQQETLPQKPDLWGDFAIGRAEHLKENYKLRVIVYYEKKFDSVIIDAEIGGKRTIVSNRVEQRFSAFSWTTDNAAVKNIKLYRIK